MYSVEVSDAFYLLQGLFVMRILDFKHALVCHGSSSLDSVADRSIYWLSCGIRCRAGVKKYEEKMCGNDVNRNSDCIFSWLWKQQGRKR